MHLLNGFLLFSRGLTIQSKEQTDISFLFSPPPLPPSWSSKGRSSGHRTGKNMFGEFHETGLRKICLRANITGQGSFEISLKLDGRWWNFKINRDPMKCLIKTPHALDLLFTLGRVRWPAQAHMNSKWQSWGCPPASFCTPGLPGHPAPLHTTLLYGIPPPVTHGRMKIYQGLPAGHRGLLFYCLYIGQERDAIMFYNLSFSTSIVWSNKTIKYIFLLLGINFLRLCH